MTAIVKRTLVALVGPTAAGKTSLGIALARRAGGAVVSADSRQVYAGLNIGTAKPQPAWRALAHPAEQADRVAGIDHFLLNIRALSEPMTLAHWLPAARQVIDDLFKKGTLALLVGGTMLYAESIINGFVVPAVPPQAVLRERLGQESTEALAAHLGALDPAALTFIDPRNRRRIIRALEVIAATGQPFSRQMRRLKPPYSVRIVGLFPGWPTLRQAVQARARAMLRDGLLAEAQSIRQEYGPGCPLLASLNYRQATAVLDGTLSEEAAIDAMSRATLRYAHRQMSWWRRRSDIRWFESPAAALAAKNLLPE